MTKLEHGVFSTSARQSRDRRSLKRSRCPNVARQEGRQIAISTAVFDLLRSKTDFRPRRQRATRATFPPVEDDPARTVADGGGIQGERRGRFPLRMILGSTAREGGERHDRLSPDDRAIERTRTVMVFGATASTCLAILSRRALGRDGFVAHQLTKGME
ncbi:MAG: hypothetical protein ACLVL7_12035 [Anaerotruncus massiliensis (ex Togo et al. 2019)]